MCVCVFLIFFLNITHIWSSVIEGNNFEYEILFCIFLRIICYSREWNFAGLIFDFWQTFFTQNLSFQNNPDSYNSLPKNRKKSFNSSCYFNLSYNLNKGLQVKNTTRLSVISVAGVRISLCVDDFHPAVGQKRKQLQNITL